MQKPKIIISKSLEILKEQLIEDIKEHKNNVFHTTFIITTAQGVNNWLSENIANKNKIFANFKYTNIQSVFFEIYKLIHPTGSISLITQNELVWWIYEVMENFKSKDEVIDERIHKYFDKQPISCCMMIADLFDQYQIHRFEMLEKWEKDKLYFDKKDSDAQAKRDEQWQKAIWRELLQLVKDKNKKETENDDKTQQLLFYQLVQSLLDSDLEEGAISARIPALYIFNHFGLSAIHIQVLKHLAKKIPIYVYIKDERIKNIERWSNLTITTLSLWGEEKNPNDENRYIDLSKKEITIHSNYSVKREVETWYNYLVKNAEQFEARKIWVTVPDIQQYAPYIHAVMDNAPVKLHYTIADEVELVDDEVMNLFRYLLDLSYDKINVENLIQITQFKIIQQKYHLQDSEFVKSSLISSKMRRKFEFEGEYYSETHQLFSIKRGLKRLILGMFTSEEVAVANDYPIVTSEDFNVQTDLIGVAQLIDDLEQFLLKTQTQKVLQEWKMVLDEMVETFIETKIHSDSSSYLEIWKTLHTLDNNLSIQIDYIDIQRYLSAQINLNQVVTQYMNTGITFSSMHAYRGLPFDMIAILGMNSDFPRHHTKIAYDLMRYEEKEGDRNVTENDLHLMLEILCNAEHVYLSYIGKSQTTLKELFSSSVMDALNIKKVEYHGLKEDGTDDYYHHTHIDTRLEVFPENKDEKSPEKEKQYTKKDVIRFFTDSVQFYYEKQKGIRLDEEEDIAIYEDIKPGYLELWGLKNDLLQRIMKEPVFDEDQLEEFLKTEAQKGNLGIKTEKTKEDLREFFTEISKHPEINGLQPIHIEPFDFDEIQVEEIEGFWDKNDSYYFVTPSTDRIKYRFKAIINGILFYHLHSDKIQHFYYIAKKDQFKAKDYIKKEITISDDKVKDLKGLIEFFRKNKNQLQPFLLEMVMVCNGKQPTEYAKAISDDFLDDYKSKMSYRSSLFKQYEKIYDMEDDKAWEHLNEFLSVLQPLINE